MGVVYEAVDRTEERRVALKTMRRMDAGALYRFKHEFRALADVTHPNLVALFDLVADEPESAFFTMELVEGIDFLRHAGFGAEAAVADTQAGLAGASVRPPPPPRSVHAPLDALPVPAPRPTVACDLDRLAGALPQLARGVAALHARGKLHRDLKPSNVLVTAAGRLVILDFGLVAELGEAAGRATGPQIAAGTPEYMSPEQAAGSELAEPSDWYAVGVMLYEALVGRLPFDGPRLKLLMDKQQKHPTAPSELVVGVPPHLSALCMELLDPNPSRRPTGSEVLRRLGDAPAAGQARAPTAPTQATLTAPFIGREAHLTALTEGFARVEAGHAVTMFVHGASGMGKSMLLRRFADSLAQRGDVLVFAGRCYERESMPYKALDSIVDAISSHLRRLPSSAVEALLPREVLVLARLFPVLMRVEAVAGTPRRTFEVPDPHELRRRAFVALRDLMHRIAARHPVVVWIDDLQWGDSDSAGLLAELTRPPDSPPILLLGSYRSEDTASPLIAALRDPRTRAPGMDVRVLEVGPLGRQDAETLAFDLLADPVGGEAVRQQASAIAEESDGSPFFIDELVRHVQSEVPPASSTPKPSTRAAARTSRQSNPRLDEVLLRRVSVLPTDARRLLEFIAVAGQPVSRPVARQAAELSAEHEATALGVLRAGHLARSLRTLERYAVDTYHDRVRVAVLASLDPGELAARHRRIALALTTTAGADPETLATHFRAAGDLERAAEHAIAAATKAVEALAFDRAASFYEMALEVAPSSPAREASWQLRWKLGDALANAGRGPEAARAYLRAADEASPTDAVELRRRAAEQLLRSGRLEEGLAVVRTVLQAVGMDLPSTPRRALLSLVWNSVRVGLRGSAFRPRDAAQIAREELTRVDVCWSIGHALSLVDPICAASFTKRHLLLALRASDPYRVALGLATEIVTSSLAGPGRAKRTAAVAREAEAVARSSGEPKALAFLAMCRGMGAYLEGREHEALRDCRSAIDTYREHCTGVGWEISTASLFAMWSLWRLGALRELSERVPALIHDARERGDLYQDSMLRLGLTNTVWLVGDDPEQAAQEVEAAMQWSRGENQMQRYYSVVARVNLELYRGRAVDAMACIAASWPSLRSSMVFRVHNVLLEALAMRARTSLAVAAASADPGALARAATDAKRLEQSTTPWAHGMGALLRAAVAVARGSDREAVDALDRSIAASEGAGHALLAAVARRRKAELVGGDESIALLARADAFMAEQTIRDPARMTEMLAPGFVRPARGLLPARRG